MSRVDCGSNVAVDWAGVAWAGVAWAGVGGWADLDGWAAALLSRPRRLTILLLLYKVTYGNKPTEPARALAGEYKTCEKL